MSLISELKRRNVFKVGVAYIALCWVALQTTDIIVPALNLPDTINSIVVYIGIIGFPFALFFAWAFELTPEGLKKSEDVDEDQSIHHATGQKINYIIIGLMAIAIVFLLYDRGEEPAPQEIVVDEPVPTPTITEDAIPVNSIAVLPFVNMSSDPEQEYFSDGISEEILNVLAQIKDLKVTSRTSSFLFKGSDQDIPAVARQLGVSKILEGSVRKSGNRIRITAQLIEAETDVHLWSETYDRDLSDIFAVQDEISREIVDALKVTLNIDVASMSFAQGTANTEAYEQYMLGKYLMEKRTSEDTLQAKIHFERATVLDPDFAEAWARLSLTYPAIYLRSPNLITFAQSREQMETAINKALSINPDIAEVQYVYGEYFRLQNNDKMAMFHYQRAIELNPNFAEAYALIGRLYGVDGQISDAVKYMENATNIDPMSIFTNDYLFVTYVNNNQINKAEKILNRMIMIDRKSVNTFWRQLHLYFIKGQYAEVVNEYRGRLRGGEIAEYNIKRDMALALTTIGQQQNILELLADTRYNIESYYIAGNYDEFINHARDNYSADTADNRFQLGFRAQAEMTAENFPLAKTLFETLGACDVYSIALCQNLYYVNRMIGDSEAAAKNLITINSYEKSAANGGRKLFYWFPDDIVKARNLVFSGEIDAALAIYKDQLSQGFYHYEIMAPHFKELHDHPDWETFLADIKAFQADQQEKLAELERK